MPKTQSQLQAASEKRMELWEYILAKKTEHDFFLIENDYKRKIPYHVFGKLCKDVFAGKTNPKYRNASNDLAALAKRVPKLKEFPIQFIYEAEVVKDYDEETYTTGFVRMQVQLGTETATIAEFLKESEALSFNFVIFYKGEWHGVHVLELPDFLHKLGITEVEYSKSEDLNCADYEKWADRQYCRLVEAYRRISYFKKFLELRKYATVEAVLADVKVDMFEPKIVGQIAAPAVADVPIVPVPQSYIPADATAQIVQRFFDFGNDVVKEQLADNVRTKSHKEALKDCEFALKWLDYDLSTYAPDLYDYYKQAGVKAQVAEAVYAELKQKHGNTKLGQIDKIKSYLAQIVKQVPTYHLPQNDAAANDLASQIDAIFSENLGVQNQDYKTISDAILPLMGGDKMATELLVELYRAYAADQIAFFDQAVMLVSDFDKTIEGNYYQWAIDTYNICNEWANAVLAGNFGKFSNVADFIKSYYYPEYDEDVPTAMECYTMNSMLFGIQKVLDATQYKDNGVAQEAYNMMWRIIAIKYARAHEAVTELINSIAKYFSGILEITNQFLQSKPQKEITAAVKNATPKAIQYLKSADARLYEITQLLSYKYAKSQTDFMVTCTQFVIAKIKKNQDVSPLVSQKAEDKTLQTTNTAQVENAGKKEQPIVLNERWQRLFDFIMKTAFVKPNENDLRAALLNAKNSLPIIVQGTGNATRILSALKAAFEPYKIVDKSILTNTQMQAIAEYYVELGQIIRKEEDALLVPSRIADNPNRAAIYLFLYGLITQQKQELKEILEQPSNTEKQTFLSTLQMLNNRYGNVANMDAIRTVVEKVVYCMVNDSSMAATMTESDEQNAKIQSDKLLGEKLLSYLKDHFDIFKLYSDNQDFKRDFSAMIFGLLQKHFAVNKKPFLRINASFAYPCGRDIKDSLVTFAISIDNDIKKNEVGEWKYWESGEQFKWIFAKTLEDKGVAALLFDFMKAQIKAGKIVY